jgi:ABC-type Fe3+ transport system substrate-binding protein|tara:strand:+ start:3558 stop:4859 length:1302 start_codon:yes stop_codon:yes gene_type:complete
MRHVLAVIVLGVCSVSLHATDNLMIISPHRKSIQREFIPVFKTHYQKTYGTEIEVDWLDQGGTSDDVRFVRAKFANNPNTCGIDIFWGGGTTTYLELKRDGFLASYRLPANLSDEIPDKVAGVPLFDESGTWYASAMSSFGIFYNKKILQFDNLPTPATWRDLADARFSNQLILTDPRRSGSAAVMNTIVLQSLGWYEGFELLAMIAGNNRKFTHSSSDPIKAVVAGDAAAAMAIDFYAKSKIGDLGAENLGFTLPPGQNVLDPDPVAILKGAPNRRVAERFVSFVLSADAQKLLILPRGAAGGPRVETLGRMAINRKSYEQTEGIRTDDFNPFKQKAFLILDLEKASKMRRPFNDLIGATLIDTHTELKAAWRAILRRGSQPGEIKEFGQPPVSEAELLDLAAKWEDDVFRNQTINEWVKAARKKYRTLAGG